MSSKSRYIPALDGLRAFAVLAVIAYHMNFSWAQGGLLGVTVFFVLSGYLITGLLITEWATTKTIDLKNFWMRRVKRLVPAIIFVIVTVAALCTIFNHELLTKMRPDIPSALLFFSNWWYIFQDLSYFEALGAPSPLNHFWSLAIEEQFYLIWPVILLSAFKLGAKKPLLRRATLVLAALSALAMALLFDPAADPSRVYYGTDTRAFSLLIGAWLAFVWPAGRFRRRKSRRLSKQECTILDGVGIAACVGLVIMVVFTDGFSPFLYRGGLVLASILTAIVIAVVVYPGSRFARFASAKPLVWIGKRSYGMYLWHYPILLLMNPRNFTGDTNPLYYVLEIALIFAVSAFSFKFIEDPVRKGEMVALSQVFAITALMCHAPFRGGPFRSSEHQRLPLLQSGDLCLFHQPLG
ncbi:MAG: acyltransferase [Raoultibacter sp.]